ncbi:pPIWI_RE_Z domain-containing protein [Streptomyces bacillaris]|uniref:pPIWI_RE_Z domain-containing protein n=1 Tax=Streptomyces bacillaris TaxID=68179 RepID=UPI003827B9A2
MRSIKRTLGDVISCLSAADPRMTTTQLVTLCEIELGLLLQEKTVSGAPAEDAWTLFSGHPFARAWGAVDAAGEQTLRTARHSLWTWSRRMAWTEALQEYQRLDRQLRGFEIADPADPAVRRPSLSVAPDRWRTYEGLLREAPAFAGRPMGIAGPGRHGFPIGGHVTTVNLPQTTLPRPVGHDLTDVPVNHGQPLTFCRTELLATAAFMDSVRWAKWEKRLADVWLSTRQDDRLRRADRFTVAGIQHLLGIVGAGKSTLRDVLAVHLALRHHRATVVVGDVAEQLKLVELYNTYVPQSAAPVLGATGRQRHAERLHRRLIGRGEHNLLAHDDPAFAYLSTSCALNALRCEEGHLADDLLGFGEAPCGRLQKPGRRREFAGDSWSRERLACPFWSACPRHRGARELVSADLWVATPASLIDSGVPHPQNQERIRYLELACRRSDLVIIDEADRVQMQLDRMFAPAIPLIGGGADTRSFLHEVNQHRIRELAGAGGIQLSDREVESWSAAVNTTQTAADRLVAMLVRDVQLRDWVRTGYFSAWTLQLRLLEDRYPLPEDGGEGTVGPEQAAAERANREPRLRLTETLDAFRENPFGDRSRFTEESRKLTGLLNELLHTNYRQRTRERLETMLRELFDLDPLLQPTEAGRRLYGELRDLSAARQQRVPMSTESTSGKARRRRAKRLPETSIKWLELLMVRFEFTLLLSALEPKLSLINAMWPRVAAALNLGFNEMYRRPLDYGPMVPEAPMGNVIGFQFLMDGPDLGGVRSGELRFFRCSGVGRELLREMPRLAKADGRPGTNVLLMSGSSWAGSSSRYHIPVDIGVIIEPDPEELDRIADHSEFRFDFIRDLCGCRADCTCDGRNEAQRLSGEPLDQRPEILRRMATELGREDLGTSRLRAELSCLPESRRHILLLVGSYDEAKVVADTLHTLNRRWKGRAYRLVSDDDPEPGNRSDDDERHAPVLRRGDVETLADTGADILVAPLLAVERGHNILDLEREHAAIGSIYFLARPNPRPDDLGLAVHAINDWIVRAVDDGSFAGWVRGEPSLGLGARKVRDLARSQWYRVLARSMAWRSLGGDREPVTWDLLVLIWQVIGRSVRGAVPTRVAFVDAAFSPNLAAGGLPRLPDTPKTSLLHSIHAVLRPYFTPGSAVSAVDRRIVEALYRPMWSALDRCLFPSVDERSTTCTS